MTALLEYLNLTTQYINFKGVFGLNYLHWVPTVRGFGEIVDSVIKLA